MGERRLFPIFLQIRFDFRRREGFAPFDFRFGGSDVVDQFDGLAQTLEIFDRQQHGGRLAVLGDEDGPMGAARPRDALGELPPEFGQGERDTPERFGLFRGGGMW